MEPNLNPPSLIRRIFFATSDSRLRSGWRLVIHTILVVVFVGLFQLLITFIALQLGLIGETELTDAVAGQLDSPLLMVPSVLGISLATWLVRRWLDRKSFLGLGLGLDRHTALDLAFGILAPGLLFAAIYLIESAAGWLEFESWAWETLPASAVIGNLARGILLFIFVGYQEELLSRGYHLQTLADGLNVTWGLLISAGVFAVLHASNPSASLLSTAGIFAAGLFLAYGWIRTGKLWISIGIHIGWNFFQGPIFGFPVSGTQGFHLITHSVRGPVAITGGAFGPEAGLLGLGAMALGSVLIWAYTRGRSTSGAELLTPSAEGAA